MGLVFRGVQWGTSHWMRYLQNLPLLEGRLPGSLSYSLETCGKVVPCISVFPWQPLWTWTAIGFLKEIFFFFSHFRGLAPQLPPVFSFALPQFSALTDYWPLSRLDRALSQEIQRKRLLPSLFSSDHCTHMAPVFTHHSKIEVWWGVLPFHTTTSVLAYCQIVTFDRYIFFISSLLRKVPHRNTVRRTEPLLCGDHCELWWVWFGDTAGEKIQARLMTAWVQTGSCSPSSPRSGLCLTLGFTSSLLLFIMKTCAQKTSVMI